MIHRAKVLAFDPAKNATVAVQVELDIDLPALAAHMANQAMRSKRKKSTSAGRRVKARLVWRPHDDEPTA